MHCELAALVQVSAESQPLTVVHAVHTVGTPVLRHVPAAHCVQIELPAVLQLVEPVQLVTAVHVLHSPESR